MQHLTEIQEDPLSNSQGPTSKELSGVQIGAGLPPVPQKLAQKIQSGDYVDMTELLPDHLGISDIKLSSDKQQGSKKKGISSILEWVQCFSIYVSVIALKEPQRIPDLLGYMNLIIEAHQEYSGDAWQGYNRRFRQRAAVTTQTKWATIDPTLWNLAFTGHAHIGRCKHCFSLYHTHDCCDWAPQQVTSPLKPRPTPQLLRSPTQGRRICLSWNNTPSPDCSFPGCKYEHICCICAKIPHATDVAHKAIYCRHRNNPQYSYQNRQTGGLPFPASRS